MANKYNPPVMLDDLIHDLQKLASVFGNIPVLVDGMTGDRGIVDITYECDDEGTESEREYLIIAGEASDMECSREHVGDDWSQDFDQEGQRILYTGEYDQEEPPA